MKFLYKLTMVLALGGCFWLSGCADDGESFLKRNLREMSFPYSESSNTFTIRATDEWYISDRPGTTAWTGEYSWVHVDQTSGKGNPDVYQKITVTCDRNTQDERQATIYLHGSGESDVAIQITQANGIFEWTPFDNGRSVDVAGIMKLNEESAALLRIPYIKALGTETYTFTINMTGGNGLTAASGNYPILVAGDGYVEIPITGTATKQGIVTFAVKASADGQEEVDFGEVTTIVRAGFDAQGEEIALLDLNFDLFPWGGDYIGKKAGITTSDKTVANLSLSNATVSVASTNNAGIGGITSTVRNGNAVFYNSIGMTGWTGYRNYMRPGYMEMGVASDTANEPGHMISPVLSVPTGYDVLLTCRVATVVAGAPDQIMFAFMDKIDGINITNGGLNRINASTKRYFTLDIPTYTWVDVAVAVPNPGTMTDPAFLLCTADTWFNGSTVRGGLWFVDDIKLVY